jgi:hypothetical protein
VMGAGQDVCYPAGGDGGGLVRCRCWGGDIPGALRAVRGIDSLRRDVRWYYSGPGIEGSELPADASAWFPSIPTFPPERP